MLSYQEEVVDDSEPEREEYRLKVKQMRRDRRAAAKTIFSHKTDTVIEISDDADLECIPNLVPRDATSQNNRNPHVRSTSLLPPDQLLVSGLAIFASADSTQPVASHVGVPAPISGDDAFENGTISEADVIRLNLDHFAHKPTLPHQTLFLHEPFRSRSLDSAVSIDVKRNRDRAKGYPFADEFTEATLAKLKRCVSCELTWTARKTTSQMMTHIQSCGKKQGVTDHTLRILIRKEIDAASPPKTGPKSMGKVKFLPEDKASTTRETLLEAVINDAAPKKRSGRRTVIETVKSVTETRDDILKKAQDVLRSHSSADLEPSTSRVPGRDEPRGISDDTTSLSQTQIFGRSPLAAYSGHFSALRQPYLVAEAITPREDASFPNQEDRNSEVSPATQTMAPSKLQGALGLDMHEISVLSQAGTGPASSESINKCPPLDTRKRAISTSSPDQDWPRYLKRPSYVPSGSNAPSPTGAGRGDTPERATHI